MPSSQRKAGALLSYASLAVNAIASFVYVPILLGALATEEYGVYELIGSIVAYLSVMDMGLCTTLNRFYVKARVSRDEEEIENLLATAAVIYAIIAALAVLVGLGCDRLLGTVLGSSFTVGELELAHRMMALVIVNCAVVLPGNWFLALINANERFVFARTLSIVKYVVQIGVVIAVLAWHPGALAVLAVQVACNAAAVVAYAVYVVRVLPVRVRLHRWDGRLVGSLLVFSGFILLNMVFDQVFWKTGQVVLGASCGSVAVAVYGIACKVITSGYMQLSTGVTSVFLPELTGLVARGNARGPINELFCRIGRLQAYLVWGVCGGFVVLGQPFVLLWAGEDFALAYPAIIVLMLGLSVALIQNLGISVLQALNRMGFRAGVYTVLAVADVVISIPMARTFGVMGVAVTAAILLFVGTGPVMNAYYHRSIGIDIGAFWRGVLPIVLPVAVAALVTAGAIWLADPQWSWAALVLFAVLYAGVLCGASWLWTMNAYEKGLVRGLADVFRARRVSLGRRPHDS